MSRVRTPSPAPPPPRSCRESRDRERHVRPTRSARQRPGHPVGAGRSALGRPRAPRGADLHARQGRRARAPRHAPVPVRGVLPQAEGRGGADVGGARRGPALAQDAPRDQRAGDAPPRARPEPADGGRRGAASGPTELPDARLRLPGRRADRALAVRRGGACATSPSSSDPKGWHVEDAEGFEAIAQAVAAAP